MKEPASLNRRTFLTGHGWPSPNTGDHHISSAVVTVLPSCASDVGMRLRGLDGVEVHAAQGSKIVITIEGAHSGVLGERLVEITLLDGVISANMVCEYMDNAEGCDDDPSADPP